jgi:hypothetical protein
LRCSKSSSTPNTQCCNSGIAAGKCFPTSLACAWLRRRQGLASRRPTLRLCLFASHPICAGLCTYLV